MTSAHLFQFPLPPNNFNRRRPPRLKTTTTTTNNPNDDDRYTYDPDDVKTLTKFHSPHNQIHVIQVSRLASHPLAGARLLLLDRPGNIHSLSLPLSSSVPKSTYFDVFATVPPIAPLHAPIAILGFGAGSAANLLLSLYPHASVHGWELDPSVLAVAREFFGLDELEEKHGGSRLFVHVGDAMGFRSGGAKFSVIFVDLFSRGSVLPELQEVGTWEMVKEGLVDGGRVVVNCGGGCVEAEDPARDGMAVMEATVGAMAAAFGADKVFVLSLGRAHGCALDSDSFVAVTGSLPERRAWKKALPDESLGRYVDFWMPFGSF